MNDEREALARYSHEAWSGWMEYMFTKGRFEESNEYALAWIMPSWAVDRWQRQMNTPYDELPEEEKESDRKEADKILAAIARVKKEAKEKEKEDEATAYHAMTGDWLGFRD